MKTLNFTQLRKTEITTLFDSIDGYDVQAVVKKTDGSISRIEVNVSSKPTEAQPAYIKASAVYADGTGAGSTLNSIDAAYQSAATKETVTIYEVDVSELDVVVDIANSAIKQIKEMEE